MTLDEAIKHAEEVAKQNEEDAVIYSNCKNHKKNLYEIGLAENAEKKCCKCAEEHRQLAEWLKELKRLRERTRWISCKERLPEKDGEYLVTMLYFGEKTVALDCFSHYETDDEDNGKPLWVYGYDNVIAWMPLPKPWKGEQHGTSRAVLSQKPMR